jgi:serine/threonine-protein kinase
VTEKSGQADTAGGSDDGITVMNGSAKETPAPGDPAAGPDPAGDVDAPGDIADTDAPEDGEAPEDAPAAEVKGGTSELPAVTETGPATDELAGDEPAGNEPAADGDARGDAPGPEATGNLADAPEAGQAEVADDAAATGAATAQTLAGLGQHALNGRLLGNRYRLVERIAVGGMGQVWRGTDEILGRPVAVKLMSARHASDEQFRTRFQAEARYAASLSHPGIARVYDYGESDQDTSGFGLDPAFRLPYLVMELVEGEPLSAAIARDGRMPVGVTLDLVAQSARALGAAHAAGIVHRDIKPGNLLITLDGQVKITDFGIARAALAAHLTQTGMVMGTAQYVSPEQASARPVTSAADIYSLGVVAYECLAGQPPFTAEVPIALALAHVRQQPPPLPDDVPTPVAALIGQMLAKEPADRPASAQAVAARASALKASPGDGADAWTIGSDEMTGPAAWFSDPSPTTHDSTSQHGASPDSASQHGASQHGASQHGGRINTAPIAGPLIGATAARRSASRRPGVRILAAAAVIVAAAAGTLAALVASRHPAAPVTTGGRPASHRPAPARSHSPAPGLGGGTFVPSTRPASQAVHRPSPSPTTGSPSPSPTTSSPSPTTTPTTGPPPTSPPPTTTPPTSTTPSSTTSIEAKLPLAGPQRPSTTTQDG